MGLGYKGPELPTVVPSVTTHPTTQRVLNPALYYRKAYLAADSNPLVALAMPQLNRPGGLNVVSPFVGKENRVGDLRYAQTPVVKPH
jgi:hypothetical protein